MKKFVGIDLGTTNSAICLYDGEELQVLKSPEQNDVTPSAIFIDRRGNKYIGKRAYDAAPGNPDNAALLFKRLMGSSTKIHFQSTNEDKTPEECSAEVLKVLFGYLPEEIRNDSDIGTVITVPAAFNQMQKDATVQAAHMAGIGKVALMQEPVAAVMSVMRTRKTDGIFIIYDFGGGTLDVAVAESLNGRVNLLANGGIQMCGGRDIDRAIFDNIVKPWLFNNFDLPENLMADPQYKRLIRYSNWAVERAKIELSAREETKISLDETLISTRDQAGDEIYLDIILTREQVNPLFEEKIMDSVVAVRETLNKAGLQSEDLEKIVFIGGPTNYKPLRDRVCNELGIAGSIDINPMTAVAEGAALFAESIDWSTQDNARKSTKGKIEASKQLNLKFAYIARTPELKAKIVAQLSGDVAPGTEFQIDCIDSGWTSGRVKLENGAAINLTLAKNGDNNFKIFVFNPEGGIINLIEDKITITRTAATVDAIPASHSIGIAVKDKNSGAQTLEWLVRSGDSLPQKGKINFKAAETLKAGSPSSINFNVWEGEILEPVTDNRPIGTLKIKGTDFDDGVISAGTELVCEYEMLDSGAIHLEVSVPSIGASFQSNHNFYSRQEGQIDFASAGARIQDDYNNLENRIEDIKEKGIIDDKIRQVKDKLAHTKELTENNTDIEKTQEAQEKLLEAKKILYKIRCEHLPEIRKIDLDDYCDFFETSVKDFAKPSEIEAFEALRRTAQRNIERNSNEFESILDEIKRLNFRILWRQDGFVIDMFNYAKRNPHMFSDRNQYNMLIIEGDKCLQNDNIDKLRDIYGQLVSLRIYYSDDNFMEQVNILRG
jgi:molecular chaperone DnaK